MTKIASQRKLKWCLQYYDTQEITSKWAAQHLKFSQRRFQQVYKQYKQTGKIPNIGLKVGRPPKIIPQEWKTIIKQQYEKTYCNAIYLGKKIRLQRHIHISYNMIHRVLLELGHAKHEIAKQKR
jgi:hypothetical protein